VKVEAPGNTVSGLQEGPNTISFPDGDKITFHYARTVISGLILGKRIMSFDGTIRIEDTKNNLYCELDLLNSPDTPNMIR